MASLRGSLEPDRLDPPQYDRGHAGVALTIRPSPDSGEPELLLVRRATFSGDPWSGHMALPGGRWQSSDPSLRATAIRETLEETGVDLSGSGAEGLLGRLPIVEPRNRHLPPTVVHPFVFVTSPDTRASVTSHEVAEVCWAPVPLLADPTRHGTYEVLVRDGASAQRGAERPLQVPGMVFNEQIVWGLTYRILTEFMRRTISGLK